MCGRLERQEKLMAGTHHHVSSSLVAGTQYSHTRTPLSFHHTEKQVMRAKEERDQELALLRATDREELKRAVVVKMKNVTSADEDTCSRLLEQNNFDLEVSIEKYYQS